MEVEVEEVEEEAVEVVVAVAEEESESVEVEVVEVEEEAAEVKAEVEEVEEAAIKEPPPHPVLAPSGNINAEVMTFHEVKEANPKMNIREVVAAAGLGTTDEPAAKKARK